MVGCQRPCWTTFFLLCWVILALGTILAHYSLNKLIPPVQDFPKNLKDGFYKVMRVERMRDDSYVITNSSQAGLATCDFLSDNCSSLECEAGEEDSAACLAFVGKQTNVTEEVENVSTAFDNSMKRIQDLANDKYFGVPALNETAENANIVSSEINKLKEKTDNETDETPCESSIPLFCGMYMAGEALVGQVDNVTSEVDKFTDSEAVEWFNENSHYLEYLHILPYILVASMIFFTCWFLIDGACCCCGASCVGCCALIPYFLLWLVFFIISTIVVALGGYYKYEFTKQNVEQLNGNPTVEQFLDHVIATYPEFWDLVFKDLAEGLELFWLSFIIFWVFSILIMMYGICICCCCPFKKKKSKGNDDK